jgi:Protein of unknown function (DUF3040)
MSLPAAEMRALSRIERTLQTCDPQLRSLFAIFTRLTRHESMPGIERLGRTRWRWVPPAAVPIGLLLIIALFAVGALRTARPCAAAARQVTAAAVHHSARACAATTVAWPKAP